ncbi:MAG: DegV family protein [Clostridiales bacterium]|nr:DegV family protein [Clostridiales bacterium]
MDRFAIVTDSSADLTQAQMDAMHIDAFLPLSFSIDEQEYRSYPDERELTSEELYATLRNTKARVATSQINPGATQQTLGRLLEEGRDVLYIAFSSGLSGTYTSARLIADELAEQYPDRKLFVVDTLCACVGVGLLVEHVAAMREAGCSIEDARNWLEQNKLRVCHWISVDDLGHLYRGGRLSAATAVVGTALGIKPIIQLNEEGKLVTAEKVRGKNSLYTALARHLEQADSLEDVWITHADAGEDASKLAETIKKLYPVGKIHFSQIGPVIGCHTGPGTMALVFLGTRGK